MVNGMGGWTLKDDGRLDSSLAWEYDVFAHVQYLLTGDREIDSLLLVFPISFL